MTIRYLRLAKALLIVLLSSLPVLAAAGKVYLAKDRDETAGEGDELNFHLNWLESKRGIIFYSGCMTKYGTDILLISNVWTQGLLLEFGGRKLAHLVFVDLKGYDGIKIEEMMGGMQQRYFAQNNVNQIEDMPFYIFSGKNPAEIFDMKFSEKCADYTER